MVGWRTGTTVILGDHRIGEGTIIAAIEVIDTVRGGRLPVAVGAVSVGCGLGYVVGTLEIRLERHVNSINGRLRVEVARNETRIIAGNSKHLLNNYRSPFALGNLPRLLEMGGTIEKDVARGLVLQLRPHSKAAELGVPRDSRLGNVG